MSTLAELRTETREALLEKATDKGLIPSDVMLNRWINRANQSVWTLGLQRNPAAWAERSLSKSMPTTGKFELDNLGFDTIRSVLLVERLSGAEWLPLLAMEGLNEHSEWDDPGTTLLAGPDPRWYVEANTLRFAPAPTVPVTFRAKFVTSPVTMTADTDDALGGRYAEHHGLVALRAAQLLYHRDEVRKTPWDEEIANQERQFIDTLRRSQGGITRRVNRRRAY